MILSFACKETEELLLKGSNRRFAGIMRQALRRLYILNAVVTLEELRMPPGNHLKVLSGNRAGQHSLRINDQWRLCFVWKDGHAHEAAIVDYH